MKKILLSLISVIAFSCTSIEDLNISNNISSIESSIFISPSEAGELASAFLMSLDSIQIQRVFPKDGL